MPIEQGLHHDYDITAYLQDPCPDPSFTQSMAKILIERSPAHAWTAHPRLNPLFEPDDATAYDIGTIAHARLLGRGRHIEVLPEEFTDWRTKAARDYREQAKRNYALAVLRKDSDQADAILAATRRQLAAAGLDFLFDDSGDAEVVMAWDDPACGWCRQMLDWLAPQRKIYADFKTTRASAAPHTLGRMMVSMGWDIQSAMALRGLQVVKPELADASCLFVVQEIEPPYALSIAEMSETALTMGRKKLAYAMNQWAACMYAQRWPGYPRQVVVPDYPGWAEADWLTREEEQHIIGNPLEAG